jgi:hypothetical protein
LPNWHTNSAYQASDQCTINIHKCFHSGETYHHQYVIVRLIILISNSPQKPWFSTLSLFIWNWMAARCGNYMGYDHGIHWPTRTTGSMRLAAATAESGCCNSLVGTFAAGNHDASVWTLRSKRWSKRFTGDKDGQAKVNSTKCRKVIEHHVICVGTGNALRSYMNTCSAWTLFFSIALTWHKGTCVSGKPLAWKLCDATVGPHFWCPTFLPSSGILRSLLSAYRTCNKRMWYNYW